MGENGIPALSNNLEKIYGEIITWSLINHPSLVKLYEVIDDPKTDKMYCIMNFCKYGQIQSYKGEDKYEVSDEVVNRIISTNYEEVKHESET